MRLLRFTLICLAVVVWGRPIQGQTDAAEASLRSRIAAHERASAQNDLRGLVDVYSLDAEMISGAGAIRIRFVTPDVALIDLPSRSVGGQDAAGQPLTPSELT